MDKDLINAYAHGNLHEILLVNLFAEMIQMRVEARNLGTETAITKDMWIRSWKARIQGRLRQSPYPAQDPLDGERIRQEALRAAEGFFQSVQEILLHDDQP